MVREFKDIGQLKGIISRIPSGNVLDSFIELNSESLKRFVMPKRYKAVNEEGDLYCSDCGYVFVGEENDWNYCAGCLKEIACCEDYDFCDRLNEKLEEDASFLVRYLYDKIRENKNN